MNTLHFKLSKYLQFIHSSILFCIFSSFFTFSLANAKENMWFQSAETRIHFTHLNSEQGLSHPAVEVIEQDELGYIWLGTNDGLNRFDGVKIRHYNAAQGESDSLASDWINDIHSDQKGRLWVATKRGINLYLPDKDAFKVFENSPNYPELNNANFTVIAEAADEIMWFGSGSNRLIRYDPKSDKFKNYDINQQQGNNSENTLISDLLVDSKQRLWVSTANRGLSLALSNTGEFQRFSTSSELPIPSNKLSTLFEDDSGRLWVGTFDAGVFIFDLKNGVTKNFRYNKDDPNSLCSDYITDIYQDSMGRIWLGTYNGLCEYYENTNLFVSHKSENFRQNSLIDNRVNKVFQDKGGVFWVATMTGASRWNAKLEPFTHISNKFGLGQGMVSNVVTSFAQDSEENLYIGTWGGGFSQINALTKDISTELVSNDKPFGLQDNRVMSLLVDSKNNLWVGTQRKGLFKREKGQLNFQIFNNKPEDITSISSNAISRIIELKDGTIVVGTYGGGVNLYQTDNKFVRLKHSATDVNSLSNNNVLDIIEGNNQDLWIATSGGGLNHYSIKTKLFSQYLKDPSEPNSIGSNDIYSLLSTENYLWIATEDNGIARLSLEQLKIGKVVFEKMSRKDGLLSNMVYGLIEDDNGYIWFSHSKGLSRLSPDDLSVMNFNTSHGLQDNDFNSGAYFKSSKGQLFFGGANGFNTFMPDAAPINDYDTPLRLTKFSIFNQHVPFHQAFNNSGVLELAASDSVISFEFAALDYTKPGDNQYQYKMEGIHASWINSDSNNHITFSNLADGKYTFKVRGTNNDGLWGSQELTVPIEVLPPRWKTWWAYTLYCLTFLIILWAITRAQRNKVIFVKMVNEQLESKVLERTKDLQRANEKLEEISFTDQLTGLKNRHFLFSHLDTDINLLLRNYHTENTGNTSMGPDLIFFVIDLDHFKQVNDIYGHAAGDAVLIQIKLIFEQVFRASDYFVRLGGEEFLVVARYSVRENAPILAERLRQSVAAYEFDIGNGNTIRKTCSIGFACFPFAIDKPDKVSWEYVIDIADHCLYTAKNSARNAWVGIENIDCSDDNLTSNITNKTKQLITAKHLQVMTSLPETDDIKWNDKDHAVCTHKK